MHLYFISRGVNHQHEMWKTWMQCQMWPWKRVNKETGQEEVTAVQGALRPIQLWEYVFPEECLPDVLTMLDFTDGKTGYWGKGKAKYGLPLLRKALGAEPIPNVKPTDRQRFIYREGVGIEAIGIKKDAHGEMKSDDGKTIWEQEYL